MSSSAAISTLFLINLFPIFKTIKAIIVVTVMIRTIGATESFTKIPTMLLQPFVENVFVHAFNESSISPKLIISFKMISNTLLECKIIDNGKGMQLMNLNKL